MKVVKNRIRIIFGYTSLFIESILLFLLAIILIFKFTILDSNYVKKQLEKDKYYEKMYKDIKTEMSYYTEQSGFDDTIIEDVFTLNEVKTVSEKFVTDLYNGNKSEIYYDDIKKKLNDNMQNYITNQNFKIVNQEEVDKFSDEMIKVFDNEIRLMGYTDAVAGKIPKIISLSDYAIMGLIIALIFLITINWTIFKRKYFGVIFFTCAFLSIFIVIAIINSIDINNISIYSEIVSKVIKIIVKDILHYMIYITIGCIFMGFIFSIFEREKRRHRRHHV